MPDPCLRITNNTGSTGVLISSSFFSPKFTVTNTSNIELSVYGQIGEIYLVAGPWPSDEEVRQLRDFDILGWWGFILFFFFFSGIQFLNKTLFLTYLRTWITTGLHPWLRNMSSPAWVSRWCWDLHPLLRAWPNPTANPGKALGTGVALSIPSLHEPNSEDRSMKNKIPSLPCPACQSSVPLPKLSTLLAGQPTAQQWSPFPPSRTLP